MDLPGKRHPDGVRNASNITEGGGGKICAGPRDEVSRVGGIASNGNVALTPI